MVFLVTIMFSSFWQSSSSSSLEALGARLMWGRSEVWTRGLPPLTTPHYVYHNHACHCYYRYHQHLLHRPNKALIRQKPTVFSDYHFFLKCNTSRNKDFHIHLEETHKTWFDELHHYYHHNEAHRLHYKDDSSIQNKVKALRLFARCRKNVSLSSGADFTRITSMITYTLYPKVLMDGRLKRGCSTGETNMNGGSDCISNQARL